MYSVVSEARLRDGAAPRRALDVGREGRSARDPQPSGRRYVTP